MSFPIFLFRVCVSHSCPLGHQLILPLCSEVIAQTCSHRQIKEFIYQPIRSQIWIRSPRHVSSQVNIFPALSPKYYQLNFGLEKALILLLEF